MVYSISSTKHTGLLYNQTDKVKVNLVMSTLKITW